MIDYLVLFKELVRKKYILTDMLLLEKLFNQLSSLDTPMYSKWIDLSSCHHSFDYVHGRKISTNGDDGYVLIEVDN